MANPSTERMIIGSFAFFLEAGTTVDNTIVAAETVVSPAAGKPDASPTANWSAYALGNVENAKFSTKTVDEPFMVPSAAGGYTEEIEKRVVADLLDLKVDKVSEIFHRLVMGAASTLVVGTAQAPHVQADRKLTGWLRIQARKNSGSDIFLLDWWCELRLKEIPEFGEKSIRPTYEFRKLYSSLNSVNFPA